MTDRTTDDDQPGEHDFGADFASVAHARIDALAAAEADVQARLDQHLRTHKREYAVIMAFAAGAVLGVVFGGDFRAGDKFFVRPEASLLGGMNEVFRRASISVGYRF